MANVHVVIAFDRTSVDTLVPCAAVEAGTAEAVAGLAKSMVPEPAGAVALSRTEESKDGQLIVSVGGVDLVVLKGG